jgi:hypothetical protein
MHPQRPTNSRKTHQAADEVGELLGEDPKLVDDDGDTWQPRQFGVPARAWAYSSTLETPARPAISHADEARRSAT